MNRTLLVLLGVLMVQNTIAQRVNLDRFNFTAVYRSFPSDPLPESYKTYNVRVEASPSLLAGYGLENAIDISGLRKVQGTGHITVLAILDDIVIDRAQTRERIEVKRDKQGAEVKIPHYSTQFSYSFSARASVYDYKGNTLLSNLVLYSRDHPQVYKTGEFNTAEAAMNYYANKSAGIRQNLSRQLVNTALRNLNNTLNQKFGYGIQRVNDILWILNNRRHPEYRAHQKAWAAFKNAIVLMDAEHSLDEVKAKMQPAIDYFQNVKKRYTGTNKEARKLRYASYFNLAKIYLYLDEPEKALREADALSMNDYDERDGKYLRASAEQLEAIFRRNNASSRHFTINMDDYEPPVK